MIKINNDINGLIKIILIILSCEIKLITKFSFIIYVVFVSKAKPNRYMNCEETINEATITENEDI